MNFNLFEIFLLIIVLLIISTIASNIISRRRINKLIKSREIMNRNKFIKTLLNKGYFETDIEIVYDEINKYITNSKFSLYPEDDLYKVVEIDEFEDNELINSIFEKVKLEVPEQTVFDELDKYSTSFDAIYLLNLIELARNNHK